MRRVILLTTLLFIVSLGFSNSQTKGKQKGQVQFSEIIKKIEKKFEVSITYETDISFNLTKKQVERVIKMKTVEKALATTLKSKNISFKKIRNDYYVLSKTEKKALKTYDNFSNDNIKERVISGVVTDKNEEAIPGVTVVLENTTIATMTDLDGKFNISIPSQTGVLIISYMGYITEKVIISEGNNFYTVTLETDEFGLDEVIVSGVAGNTPTKKMTVTVVKVNGEALNKAPASSASSALQGKIAGVVVKSGSGSPGGGSTIKMRGINSIRGSSAPLIIVDGIITNTSLADISVADIESMEVVKGAAAASLYGSKAANGVIVITTKRGKNIKDGFRVSVRNEYGVTSLAKELELATHHPFKLADDYTNFSYTKYDGIIFDDEGEITIGDRFFTDSAYCDQPYGSEINHHKDFFKKGKFYTNYVGLSKKSENINMFLSFENYKNTGIIVETNGYLRKNFRFNADLRLNPYISVATSNMYMISNNDNMGTSNGFWNLLLLTPDIDLHAENIDGSPFKVKPDKYNDKVLNPLYPLYYRESTLTKNSYFSNISLKVDPTEWLNVEGKFTFEKLNKSQRGFNPVGYLYPDSSYINGSLSKSHYIGSSNNFQTTANFNKIFNDFTVKSKISYLLENSDWESFQTSGKDFFVNNIPQFDYMPDSLIESSSYNGKIVAQNIFGILDVDYKSKYIFSGLIRRDGSSLFGINERWHTYYRVAGAYRITEDFKIPNVQELKIRAAYGIAGIRPGFSDQYETYILVGDNLIKDRLGNKNLKPARAAETEIALDIHFLKKFKLSASWSQTITKDVLLRAPIKSYLYGFPSQIQNVGEIKSNSIELSLNSKVIDRKKTKLMIGLFFDRVRQKVVKIDINNYYSGSFLVEDGQEYGVISGTTWLTSLGQMAQQLPDTMTINDYEVNNEGYVIIKGTQGSKKEKPIMLDEDNDGNPDKVVIANCNPDFNMNISTNLSYGNFSLYMLWSWKQGGDIYNATKQYLFLDNRAKEIDQFGKPENEKKSYIYYRGFYNGNLLNSYFVEDGTFVKLREISLSYLYKPKNNNILKSVKFSVIGRNLLTFTKYTGYDPEVGSSTNFSYDNFGYPNFRGFTGAIEFVF